MLKKTVIKKVGNILNQEKIKEQKRKINEYKL